ncbi:uncharacterized protein LOC135706512 [Ochlerotatus camptorhynchus]|uniref:uncharacterized protein LOC135706512 n=1 Tax=Ochlerotatus camptorhynchus TaxID=644619 RepID=UPI0031E2BD28
MPEKNCPKLIEDPCGIPEWINAKYFETMLRKCKYDPSIKVPSIDVKYALAKGENFASVIYRVHVVIHSKDHSERIHSYIIKGMSETPLIRQMLGEYNVHGKEMDVYQLVIPELQHLMRSIEDHSDLYLNALCVDRNNDVMLFDDILELGYVMIDRITGLDAIHTKMSLNAMAKLHATSMKLAEIYPTMFDRYKTGMMTRETDAFHDFFRSTYDALTDEIYTWDLKWHYYANKLRKLRPYYLEQGMTVFDNDSEHDLRVFVHGDLWVNNLMFKYDINNGQPIDVILFDFQYCCYGTPAIDLCYFFFTSTRDDIRQNGFEEYMQYYYNGLAAYTQRLHCTLKFPTLHQFQRQLLKKMFYAIHSCVVALPIHINDGTVIADSDALFAGDEHSRLFKKAIMTNEKYHKIMKGLLPTFDRKGLLDKLD